VEILIIGMRQVAPFGVDQIGNRPGRLKGDESPQFKMIVLVPAIDWLVKIYSKSRSRMALAMESDLDWTCSFL
jgi:hypothetical protein